MRPLLYVCVRPQEGAAAAEYESFRQAMRLEAPELDRLDLVRGGAGSSWAAARST